MMLRRKTNMPNINIAEPEGDPFTMTFGHLKRLLIAEEVVGPGCLDTEIRDHVAAQAHARHDVALLAQPLKYQMAWLVKELDLHHGFGAPAGNPLHAWTVTAPKLLQSRPGGPHRALLPKSKSVDSELGVGSGGGQRCVASASGFVYAGSRGTSRSSTPRRDVKPKTPPPPPSSNFGQESASQRRAATDPLTTRKHLRSSSQVSRPMAATRAVATRPVIGRRPQSACGRIHAAARAVVAALPPSPRVGIDSFFSTWSSSATTVDYLTSGDEEVQCSSARDANAAVAWRRVLGFLRHSQEGAGAVEGIFKRLDRSGDGVLDGQELCSGLVQLGVRLNEEQRAAFVHDCDKDGDGETTLAEFSAAFERMRHTVAKHESDGWADILHALLLLEQTQSTTPEQRLEQALRSADGDGNGNIDLRELSVVFESIGARLTATQTAIIRDAMDEDGDGAVTLHEFMIAMSDKKRLVGDGAWKAIISFMHRRPDSSSAIAEYFKTADKDGSGSLDLGELGLCLTKMGIKLSKLQLRVFREQVDENKDGEISFEEFESALKAKAATLGLENPDASTAHEASSAVAWHRVLKFLLDKSSEGAAAVEGLFGNDWLSGKELCDGLIKLGVRLDSHVLKAFQKDCDENGDGQITFIEFSAAVEAQSLITASGERGGWTSLLTALLLPMEGGLPVDPEQRVLAAFNSADADGSGDLDTGELSEVLEGLGARSTATQAALVMETIDINGDGSASLSEFKAVLAVQKKAAIDLAWAGILNFLSSHVFSKKKSLKHVFEAADKDGSGELDISELTAMLESLGLNLDALQLHFFRGAIDANHDGTISLREFQSAISAKASELGIDLSGTKSITFHAALAASLPSRAGNISMDSLYSTTSSCATDYLTSGDEAVQSSWVRDSEFATMAWRRVKRVL